ncbi:MAG: ATP-dependent protease ATPase subunit HslU [Clostridia bacterium]|nr:ATP-dependent protease ATPase subunit HslU [Clostridia bacterium]
MNLSPKQIVAELDRYIIGQSSAKRAVAVALRNRYRRSLLDDKVREEITPKNIIMKGPTGVGKTEIARRLAKLVKAPFVKVEATKYTEVGYVGRDCESMVRDLVEVAVRLVKDEKLAEVKLKAPAVVEKRLTDLLFPMRKAAAQDRADAVLREEILSELRQGKLDHLIVEVETLVSPKMDLPVGSGVEISLGSVFDGMMPKKKKIRKLTVREAREMFFEEEADKLIDNDNVAAEAIRRAEQEGIIFIDEIDKIASSGSRNGADVSREGVQRDILPIVEGSTVQTKYGAIRTDYILFIAAGAFHLAKMDDLIPELQGRFPIKVELESLTHDDFCRILSQPDNAILTQYSELLRVDNVDIKFTDEAIAEVAKIAEYENETSENIGARRLHTVMEQLLEDISFNADKTKHDMIEIVIDKKYVLEHLEKTVKGMNLKKYII